MKWIILLESQCRIMLIISSRLSVLVVVLQVAKVSGQDEITDCGHVSAVDRPGKTSKICALTVLPLG